MIPYDAKDGGDTVGKELDLAEAYAEIAALRSKCEKLEKENEQLKSMFATSLYVLRFIAKGE